MGQYDELADEVIGVLTPEEASKWEGRGIEQDWPTGGTRGHARDADDPAPVASEVSAGRDVEAVSSKPTPPRRRSPADARQEARDNALVMARHALDLLRQSVDWAVVDDPSALEGGTRAITEVEGWTRTRAQRATPRGGAKTIFDLEAPGHETKEA